MPAITPSPTNVSQAELDLLNENLVEINAARVADELAPFADYSEYLTWLNGQVLTSHGVQAGSKRNERRAQKYKDATPAEKAEVDAILDL